MNRLQLVLFGNRHLLVVGQQEYPIPHFSLNVRQHVVHIQFMVDKILLSL